MKAYVYQDRTGYWVVEDARTGEKVGGYHDSELDAYRYAFNAGYSRA